MGAPDTSQIEIEAKAKADAAQPEKAKEEGDENSGNEEEEGEDADEEEFILHYEADEIESTKMEQQVDYFDDIKEMRREFLLAGVIGDKNLNKIAVQDWAPKEEDLKTIMSSKSKRSIRNKNLKNSNQEDKEEEGHVDTNEAQEIQKEKDSE